MDVTFDQLVNSADKITAIGILLGIVIGAVRLWWVPGLTHKATEKLLTDALDELKDLRDSHEKTLIAINDSTRVIERLLDEKRK